MNGVETFGQLLSRSLFAIDILEPELEQKIRHKIREYLINVIDAQFMVVHARTHVDNKLGLEVDREFLFGGNEKDLDGATVRLSNRRYRNQVSFAFGENRPLWLVGRTANSESCQLEDADCYEDLWSYRELKRLPHYKRRADMATRTSVIVPVSENDMPDIVMNIEFRDELKPSTALKDEFKLIGNIILRLRKEYEESKLGRESTVEGFRRIPVDPGYTHLLGQRIHVTLLATDIVNTKVYDIAKQKINERVFGLGVAFYALHQACEICIDVEPEPALEPSKDWSEGWRDSSERKLSGKYRVYRDGKPCTQVGYAFEKGETAVILSDSDMSKPLEESSSFIDLRADPIQDLPPIPNYLRNAHKKTYASVMCPVKRGGKIQSIVNFEFGKKLGSAVEEYSDELEELAESIVRLQTLFESSKKQRKQTHKALNELTPFLSPILDFKIGNQVDSSEETVFISYSHEDGETASKLKAILEENDIVVRIDEAVMEPGASIQQFIEDSIRESGITLSIISNTSLLSAWVALESIETFYHEKFQGNKKFIACYIDDDFLSKKNFRIDATDQIDSKLEEIQRSISDRNERKIDIADLQMQHSRLIDLRHNLGKILLKLKESLCVDIRDDKFEEGVKKVINTIKGKS